MFEALGRGAYRRRRWVIAAAAVFLAFAGMWGTGVFGSLTGAGFDDPASDSYRAAQRAAAELGRDDADMLVLYRSAERTVDDPAFRRRRPVGVSPTAACTGEFVIKTQMSLPPACIESRYQPGSSPIDSGLTAISESKLRNVTSPVSVR